MNSENFSQKVQWDECLNKIKIKAERDYTPIISPELGQFLQVLVRAKRPERILEIGTAVGYSTIWLARAVHGNTEIVTIERDEDMYLEAEKNFETLGLKDRINQKFGDALEILPSLKEKYDLVFIDGAKGQYLNYLEMIMDLVPEGGIILADNVLYHGHVQKEGHIPHKRRTMVRVLQEYIRVITEHPLLESIVLPVGDGLALSVRK
ncbi:MAG: O-methyltransferase [Halanaerobiaceae bacterium]|jgi:predicted O-methyltransferase YrrM|nr:O-methyltransferase [Halanaerobiaceae bacterium]